MGKGTDKFFKSTKQLVDNQFEFLNHYIGRPLGYAIRIPIRVVLSPFYIANDISGSAPRGFGITEFISKLSFNAIFAVAAIGTCDIALELGKKVICQRTVGLAMGGTLHGVACAEAQGRSCTRWKNYRLRSGEKATDEAIADAIAENRAELVHLPATMDLNVPLPSKDCKTCDGSK